MRASGLRVVISVCALALAGTSQRASYTTYGSGCPGSGGGNACVANNPGATSLDRLISLADYQFALEVVGNSSGIVTGFDIFTQGPVQRTVAAYLLAADSAGNPGTLLAQSTLTVDKKLGWYRAVFRPVQVPPGAKLFLSWDLAGPRRPFEYPVAARGTTSRYWAKMPSGWNGPGAFRFAWKLNCLPSTPILRNTGTPVLGKTFSIDIARARASSAAIVVTGASRTTWGPIGLPLDLSPFGAAGCSLLASMDLMLAIATDAQGNGSLVVPVPNDQRLLGVVFHNQWLVVDTPANALGLSFSNGGTATLGT